MLNLIQHLCEPRNCEMVQTLKHVQGDNFK